MTTNIDITRAIDPQLARECRRLCIAAYSDGTRCHFVGGDFGAHSVAPTRPNVLVDERVHAHLVGYVEATLRNRNLIK